MSQISKVPSGTVGETTFVTNVSSPAITSADSITFTGASSVDDTPSGIETTGSSGGNDLYVTLTNRLHATATTTDGSTVLLGTLSLSATPVTYSIKLIINAHNTTDNTGAMRVLHYCVRTNGVTATAVADLHGDRWADSGMETLSMPSAPTVSGNTLPISVTGLAGKTINWSVLMTYVKT